MPDFNFWNNRWINHQIGFHQVKPHPMLVKFLPLLKDHPNIFVPLCGKSLDMVFLKENGHKIVGVEFSEIAINEFEEENQLHFKKKTDEKFTIYSDEAYTLYQGDLFSLSQMELNGVSACYDRASMVAFDREERKRYARFLIGMTSLKLILAPVLDYGETLDGPPFSVTEDEIRSLYGHHFSLEKLAENKMPARESMQEKGIMVEKEVTWLLKRLN